MSPKDEVLEQLDDLIPKGQGLAASYKMDGGAYFSDVPEEQFRSFVTSALAAISRVAGKDSEYYNAIPQDKVADQIANAGFDKSLVPTVVGALQSLREAVHKGYLTSLEAKLRANVHDDFLTQANDLLRAGHHIAAMVIAGGVLEDHMLKLVHTRGLTWSGSGSLSKYNDNLKDTLYPQPIWRRIQSIGDVRNDAAHGNFLVVNVDDVTDALKFIPRVLTDYPS